MCPNGIEGSLYALLMTLTEIGGLIGDGISTLLTSLLGIQNDDFSNLWLLVLLCNLFSIIPIFLLPLLPSSLLDSAPDPEPPLVDPDCPVESQADGEIAIEMTTFVDSPAESCIDNESSKVPQEPLAQTNGSHP